MDTTIEIRSEVVLERNHAIVRECILAVLSALHSKPTLGDNIDHYNNTNNKGRKDQKRLNIVHYYSPSPHFQ